MTKGQGLWVAALLTAQAMLLGTLGALIGRLPLWVPVTLSVLSALGVVLFWALILLDARTPKRQAQPQGQ